MKLRYGALFAALLFSADPAGAHQDDSHDAQPRPRRTSYDLEDLRSKRYGAFELRFAPYYMKMDKEIGGATPFEDAFGKKPAWALGIEGDWQLLRIPHVGSLGPGVAWHYLSRGGTAPFTDPNAPGKSGHKQRFWVMPMYAVAVFRLDVFKRDFMVPLVPYAKFGYAAHLWQARDAGELSEATGVEGKGLEHGWTAHLGVMIHLNYLSLQSAADMDASAGVNDAYLFAEWWHSDVSSFGQGMQVGSSTVAAGLAIEF